MSAIQNLIQSSVDYAGLFPPAALPLDVVLANYAKYVRSNRNGMLARLIIPTARLTEFDDLATRNGLYEQCLPWKVSALVPTVEEVDGQFDTSKLDSSMHTITTFNQRSESPSSIVDAIEVRSATAETTQLISQLIPDSINAFVEFGWQSEFDANIEKLKSLGRANLFAKIRTGGVTEDLIPSTEIVAQFLKSCATHGVGLKATAGLHHPIRGSYRLTYESDASQGTMHGFVNVFVAACLAFANDADVATLTQVLASTSPDDFELGEESIGFGEHQVSRDQVEAIRNRSIVSFGSCSFDEPSEEFDSAFSFSAED